MKNLSNTRINRLRAQGYTTQTPEELNDLKFGIRFAYVGCVSLLIIGVSTINIPVLTAMFCVALGGSILPNHPFDYIYNYLLAGLLKKPQLPNRSKQLRFACRIATAWIASTIYLFHAGLNTYGYVLGSMLIFVASLLSTTDICIPSLIYNAIFPQNTKTA